MDLKLKDKLALVSGSTAGIGFAIAKTLAGEAARVIVNGRTQTAVDEAVAALRSDTGRRSKPSPAISRRPPQRTTSSRGSRRWRSWSTTSGSSSRSRSRRSATPTGCFEANVLSGARLARLYLPRMKAADWGRIIFISSESAVQIPAEMIHYGMTKTAQLAVSRGLAESVAGTGITVNSILPGPTKSRGVSEFVEALAKTEGKSFEAFQTEFFEKVRPTSLIKRFATPEEVATLVAYVASPLASATTGVALRVDGGVIKSAF
jgi:NAD(P)-dependent dehydrogenase (short-subunit alcohol dehydrogenase family)